MKKIKIRGLVVAASWIFLAWGGIVAVKGVYDAFWGEPEANFFSPQKWDFISRHQWLTWTGFEITYGLACVGIALVLRAYAPLLPPYIERNTDK
jgi:hypothetical protein